MSKRRTVGSCSPKGGDKTISGRKPEVAALFVYGTLIEPEMRERLLGRHVDAIRARLPGYRRGHSRYFYIVREQDATADGILLDGLGERDFRILDEYEDVPRLYTRERIRVFARGSETRIAWVYLPTGWASARTT